MNLYRPNSSRPTSLRRFGRRLGDGISALFARRGRLVPRPQSGRRRGPLIAAGLVAVVLVALLLREFIPATEAHVPPPPAPPEIRRLVVKGTIPDGGTASVLLGKYCSSQELYSLVERCRVVFPLTSLRAGNTYRINLEEDRFSSFEYDISSEEQLIIRRQGELLMPTRVVIPFTREDAIVSGSISSSLYEAVAAIGETDALAEELADIFAYDVDFIRDIRVGDSFRVLVEKRLRDGKPPTYGPIQAATFTNQGETFTAFRFQDGKNPVSYYDASGKALRKAFLKAPLPFSRVSSGFSMKRFHPIAKTWRAHPAVDYAAPVGTPIKTVGDGFIAAIGFTSGNGNYIRVRHPNGYETLYLHMSKFAGGMVQGKRVTQGQVIGYVGSSGLATGPHLCFRMVKNGAPVNPARVKAAASQPVAKERMVEFATLTAPLLARLEGREVVVAAQAVAGTTTEPPR
ncbi:MAG: hypothetical protein A2091_13315 [Desulfuromonadales bacterium GWD2_61_12]|nr:MAG: hypothetical protein A2005_02925 [Desulfuromonadales bacterium GWC2_61_20]OGR35280.1 MAG: hypothetical protein A2091_13315 [Desulfuromonadales bacterium GWD2_61_12]